MASDTLQHCSPLFHYAHDAWWASPPTLHYGPHSLTAGAEPLLGCREARIGRDRFRQSRHDSAARLPFLPRPLGGAKLFTESTSARVGGRQRSLERRSRDSVGACTGTARHQWKPARFVRDVDFHRAKRYPGGVEGLLPNT
ncbi:hypothetical protein EVAR_89954_1 [Eumeta japonica]|uniref:Uncharacterized protein n=1 Tax=Eumeta variegata TaxID=151549 RepID=A0A4C2ADR7_EUMVA|nr:hypothetical protein EVAR_89954_1 [Eumeta japonica]